MKALHAMQPLFIKSVSKDCVLRCKLNEETCSELLLLLAQLLIQEEKIFLKRTEKCKQEKAKSAPQEHFYP